VNITPRRLRRAMTVRLAMLVRLTATTVTAGRVLIPPHGWRGRHQVARRASPARRARAHRMLTRPGMAQATAALLCPAVAQATPAPAGPATAQATAALSCPTIAQATPAPAGPAIAQATAAPPCPAAVARARLRHPPARRREHLGSPNCRLARLQQPQGRALKWRVLAHSTCYNPPPSLRRI